MGCLLSLIFLPYVYPAFVCLFVCLSACLLATSRKITEQKFLKILRDESVDEKLITRFIKLSR